MITIYVLQGVPFFEWGNTQNLPPGTAQWVFHSPGGVPTVKIGADGGSRWKSQVEVW